MRALPGPGGLRSPLLLVPVAVDHESGEERDCDGCPEGHRHPEGEARPGGARGRSRQVQGDGGSEQEDISDPDPAVESRLVLHATTASESYLTEEGKLTNLRIYQEEVLNHGYPSRRQRTGFRG